jgi:hypothetical protein
MAIENPFDQKRKFKFKNKINKIKPLGDSIIVTDMNFQERITSGGNLNNTTSSHFDGLTLQDVGAVRRENTVS